MQARTETGEQQAVVEWCIFNRGKYPELDMLYHIPNEGKRSRINGAQLKLIGLKSGVPDLCLPVARHGFHALYIEMKRDKKSKVSTNQTEWIEKLKAAGNLAMVCYSADEAIQVINKYLGG